MKYKPSKKVIELLKEVRRLSEIDVIEAIRKLIEAMILIEKESRI